MEPARGPSLTIFVDCVSPYSWFGFTNTLRYRPLLEEHGVHVEIYPFFLGGARDSAGNPFAPPLKAKEAFSKQDPHLASQILGLSIKTPEKFPISSLFPVRLCTWVKDHLPAPKFEQTFLALVSGYWGKGIDISTPEGILKALKDVFPAEETKELMKKCLSPENKKRTTELTLSTGAFGAPWIIGVNGSGERKDWFGNDRWDQIFYHLGVPFTGVSIIPASTTARL